MGELYFLVVYVSKDKRVLFVLDYFRGKANKWARLRAKTYLLGITDTEIQRFFCSVSFFKKETDVTNRLAMKAAAEPFLYFAPIMLHQKHGSTLAHVEHAASLCRAHDKLISSTQ